MVRVPLAEDGLPGLPGLLRLRRPGRSLQERLVSSPLPTGTLLAGFRVETLIGEGAMGRVYLAWDSQRGERVALKLLSPELASDERFRARFLRESQLA